MASRDEYLTLYNETARLDKVVGDLGVFLQQGSLVWAAYAAGRAAKLGEAVAEAANRLASAMNEEAVR